MKVNPIVNYMVSVIALFIFGSVVVYSVCGLVGYGFRQGFLFHNVDLSYNMCLISNDLDTIEENTNCSIGTNYRDWKDRFGLGENDTVSYSDSFVSSNEEMRVNFLLFGYYGFVFGIGLLGLLFISFAILSEHYEEVRKKWT